MTRLQFLPIGGEMQDFLSDLDHGSLDPRLIASLREAQNAIVARPQISIRLRFVISLGLCFVLCGIFAFATLGALASAQNHIRLIEALDRASLAVERARVVELTPAPPELALQQARRSIAVAIEATRAEAASLAREATRAELYTLSQQLAAYDRVLSRGVSSGDALRELRASGQEVRGVLNAVDGREKEALARMLSRWRWAPAFLLGPLLLLFAVIATAFGRALVGPIRKFQAYTRRIAAGDFTLIPPTRLYRDEFSELALAVNRMLAELQSHQDGLVKAGKLAAVGTITSGIAHELNNPLNNISITTEALMEDWAEMAEEEKWRLLQDVYFETERAAEIVKSLLDFTRNERPELLPVDIAEVVQQTVRLAQNEMTLADVTLVNTLPEGLPRVMGAFDQLRQVFLNLFLNAIQAMPRGGRLAVAASTNESGRVCVEVSDTGTGIPADVLPHIFDPFFTTKEPGQGTGLGLSVTASIIKKHGGEIHVTSEPGRGTTFHVCLPIAEGS
jgi:two-component system, NtrC family, sensor kinase